MYIYIYIGDIFPSLNPPIVDENYKKINTRQTSDLQTSYYDGI